MKQLVAQAIVALVLAGTIGGVVWMIRAQRRSRGEGAAALEALARDGGYGLTEGREVERARLLVDMGLGIADALER